MTPRYLTDPEILNLTPKVSFKEPLEFSFPGECNEPSLVGVNRQSDLVALYLYGRKGPLHES
jgi:hypothetical protein